MAKPHHNYKIWQYNKTGYNCSDLGAYVYGSRGYPSIALQHISDECETGPFHKQDQLLAGFSLFNFLLQMQLKKGPEVCESLHEYQSLPRVPLTKLKLESKGGKKACIFKTLDSQLHATSSRMSQSLSRQKFLYLNSGRGHLHRDDP